MKVVARVFPSFSERNYRLFFAGQLTSGIGTWMQAVAQEWLVLELTDSPLAVGVAAAMQFVPLLLFGLYTGALADRLDKRKLLIWARAAMGVTAALLAALTATGWISVEIVYLLALALGVAAAIDFPARQSFVSELVGRERTANAISLNGAMMQTARIAGPALGGIVIALCGVPAVFVVNVLTFVVAIVTLAIIDTTLLHRAPPGEAAGSEVRDGVRYAWGNRELRRALVAVALVAIFAWNFRVVLPLMARFEFESGPQAFGLLYAIVAVGSLVGSLAMAARRWPTERFLGGAAAAFGAAMLATVYIPGLGGTAAMLVLVGFTGAAFMATANATVQLLSAPGMRGRMMALFGILVLGTIPIGGPLIGWLSAIFGPRAGFFVGGVAALVTAAGMAVGAMVRSHSGSRRGSIDAGRPTQSAGSSQRSSPGRQVAIPAASNVARAAASASSVRGSIAGGGAVPSHSRLDSPSR